MMFENETTFVLGMMALIVALLIVVIWQWFATWRTRHGAAREEAYRELAESSTAVQERLSETQGQMAADIQDLRQRVAAIEKMLREVGWAQVVRSCGDGPSSSSQATDKDGHLPRR